MSPNAKDLIRAKLSVTTQERLEQGMAVLARVAGFTHTFDRDEEAELFEVIRLEMDEVFARYKHIPH